MDRIGTRVLTFVLVAAGSFLVTGCNDQEAGNDLPPVLKIGILPCDSPEKLAEAYEPLRQHLSETLGLPCELVVVESYGELVKSFGAGTVDLAYFGGLTFLQAMVTYDAVPLVMRDIDTRFTSYFIVRADGKATDISDSEDSVFAFGAELSTSGHLMPRHFLASRDITPETFFREVRYSGAHDKTIQWVRDGTADIGAVNSQIFRAMVANGRIKKDEFRIIWETPPYSNYVWGVQSSLSEAGRTKLRNAFLVLSPNRDEHEEILRNMGAGGFLPADVTTFSELKEIASKMELLK